MLVIVATDYLEMVTFGMDNIAYHLGRDTRERPAQMPVTSIIEHALFWPAAICGIMAGIIGRKPAQGITALLKYRENYPAPSG